AGSLRLTGTPDAYILEVRDAEETPLTSFVADLAPLAAPAPLDEVLEAASAGGDVEMRLRRRYAAQGVGESFIYAPLSFELRFDDERHVVTGVDALRYTNTHHNWNDALVAQSGDTTLEWRVTYDFGPLVHTV